MSFHDTQNPGIDFAKFTTAENAFLVSLVGLAYQQGDILYYDGSKLNRLPAGTNGWFLKTQGAGANPIWVAGGGGSGDALVANSLAQFASTTSLELKGVISDETGSGALVFANTPTLVTPALGAATATSINKITITQPATGSTLTINDGFTLTVSANATVSGTNTGDQTDIVGNAGTVTVADAGGDTTTWVLLGTSQTGSLAPATDAGLTFNATTNALTATTFIGALTGNASTATALQNARTIGGVSFDGTGNITVASATGGFTVSGGNLVMDTRDISTDTTTGTKIGTGTTQKIGFFNSTPIVKPSGDVITALQNLGLVASATILATTITSRTLWGQTYDGSGNVTGSLTAVTDITGGASNMVITAGTGNSRTLTLRSTTAGGAATAFITGNADQSTTFGGTAVLGSNSITMTGSIAATGARVTKGWFADIESTNMPTVGGTAILTSLTAPQFTTIELGAASDTTLARVGAGDISVEGNLLYRAGGTDVPVADGGTGSSTAAGAVTNLGLDNTKIANLTFVIDGGGSAITTGIKGDIEIPFACTINRVTLLADQSGSVVIDVWKDTYANYPPTVADTITASAKPTITTATKSQDSTLTGWTTSVAAGDTIRFNVDSATTITRVLISLKVTKT